LTIAPAQRFFQAPRRTSVEPAGIALAFSPLSECPKLNCPIVFYRRTTMLTPHLKTARTDMKSLVKDAQELFHEATSATGEKADALRSKGLNLLEVALTKAQDVQTAALDTGKELASTTDDYVQENPWRAVAISAGIGLLIGLAMGRK
jgi:ElaB/YqjD/DUF883 family membrane-anchored ribosome-binding protein